MTYFSFTVPGEPKTWSRPRFNRKTGHVFNKQEHASHKNKISVFAMEADVAKLDGPVCVDMTFWWEWPKAKQRKRKPRLSAPKATGADVDNYAKVVLDALNGIAYSDDRQVAELRARKRYAFQGDPARTEVIIRAIPVEET